MRRFRRTDRERGSEVDGRATRRDRGFSVVEIVVTVAIVGITVIPVMEAVLTNIRASSSINNGAEVETVLQNAADRVNRAPKKCDYTVYAQAASLSEGWLATQAVVTQDHYVPNANPAVAGTWASGACIGTDSTPADLLVQRVTITVTSPDGRTHRSMQVVKSDV